MKKEEIISIVVEIIKTETDCKDINYESHSAKIAEWDSLKHVQIIAETEKRFNMKFDFDEMLGFESVADIVETVHSKLNAE
jgi:acyl carrier protein